MKLTHACNAGMSPAKDTVWGCWTFDGDTALVGDATEQLVEEAKAAALSPNTQRAYRTGWRSWTKWAKARGLPTFPADPGHLQSWLATLWQEGKKPTTLRAYRSAVAYRHRRIPGPNPAHFFEVNQMLEGISRQAAADGFAPRQAAPLRWRLVELIIDTADTPRYNRPGGRKETCHEARQRAVVDIAIVTLAHDALLRGGELLALKWADIDLPEGGGRGTVLIRRSKTDQHGQGAAVAISEFTCRALARLRPADAQPDDPIFDLSPNTLTRRIKAAAQAAGIDPSGISSHSLRVGMAQDLAASGVDMASLMLAGRWKSPATVIRYIQNLAVHHTPAAQYLETQHHTPARSSATMAAMAERPNHMSPEEFRQRGYQAVDWVADYMARLGDLPVMADIKPGDVRHKLPAEPPSRSEDFADVLADLDRVIMPGMTHWQAPGMYGYFPANTSGPAALGELIAASLGAHGAMWTTGPAVTELEQHVLDWLVIALGLPEAFRGNGVITDGASSSTLCAILAARARAGGNEKLDQMVAYTSEQSHYSIAKGLRVAGIADSRIRLITTTPDYAMRADHLAYEIVKDRNDGLIPFFVGATVGTTSTTAVDPIPELAWVASNFDAWIHVDAAFAGTAALCPEMRFLNAGLEDVDSYLFNPHKWMLTNLDCSVFYVADRANLLDAMAVEAEYLSGGTASAATADTEHEAVDYRDWTVALGRRFRALKLWFVIRHYGLEGLRTHIRRHIEWADELTEWVEADSRFELAAPTVVSLVCFRHKDGDAASRRIMDTVNKSGRAFMSHTVLDGRFTLRVAIGSPQTERHHVQELWNLIQSAA